MTILIFGIVCSGVIIWSLIYAAKIGYMTYKYMSKEDREIFFSWSYMSLCVRLWFKKQRIKVRRFFTGK